MESKSVLISSNEISRITTSFISTDSTKDLDISEVSTETTRGTCTDTNSTSTTRSGMRRLMAMAQVAILSPPAKLTQELGRADFNNRIVSASNLEIFHQGAYYHTYYGYGWRLGHYGPPLFQGYPHDNYITARMNTKKQPGVTYALDLVHRSSGSRPPASITITVNGQKVVAKYRPDGADWKLEQFDITKFLISGNNEIQIMADKDSETYYWIRSLAIVQIDQG